MLLALAALVPAGPVQAQSALHERFTLTPLVGGLRLNFDDFVPMSARALQWKSSGQAYSTADRFILLAAGSRFTSYTITGLTSDRYTVRLGRIAVGGSVILAATADVTATAGAQNVILRPLPRPWQGACDSWKDHHCREIVFSYAIDGACLRRRHLERRRHR